MGSHWTRRTLGLAAVALLALAASACGGGDDSGGSGGGEASSDVRVALVTDIGLLMTPRRTGTDGFFVSAMRRS